MTLVANGFVLQYGARYLTQIPQPTYIQMPEACLCAPSSFTKLKKNMLFCVCVVCVDVCTPHVYLLILEVRGSDPLDLELWTVMSYHVGARN